MLLLKLARIHDERSIGQLARADPPVASLGGVRALRFYDLVSIRCVPRARENRSNRYPDEYTSCAQ